MGVQRRLRKLSAQLLSTTTSAAVTDAGKEPERHPSDRAEQYSTLSQRERYLFDLQGFLILRGMLSRTEIDRINAAFDAHLNERSAFAPPNTTSGVR